MSNHDGFDFSVDNVRVSNANPPAGQRFRINSSVRVVVIVPNRSPPTTVRYFRSTDSRITPSDVQVGEVHEISGRTIGYTSSSSTITTAPSVPGTYYYGACVDAKRGEIRRSNNCTEGARVTVSADESEEADDSRAGAVPVSPGASRSGELTANDVDYFRVAVDRDSNLLVYTTGSTDTFGRLENDGARVLDSDDDGGSGRNFRIELPVPAGTYYVRVTGANTGRYTLHVRAFPLDDHGDTRTSASTHIVNPRPHSDMTTAGELTSGDTDYIAVTVDAAGTLLVYTSGGTDTVGRLEDGNGTVLAGDDNGGAGSNFRIEHHVGAGTYFVRVTGAGGRASGPYTVHVRHSAPVPRDDHGGGRGTATGISVNSCRSGELTAGDRDYFGFTVPAHGELAVYTNGPSDTVGRLDGSSTNELAADDNAGAGSNFRIERRVTPGSYYVLVTGAGGTSAGPYSLCVDFTEMEPEPEPEPPLQGADGDVRVNITWDADVDLDLHVTDPCGNVLGYAPGHPPRTRTCRGLVGEWDYDDTGHGVRVDDPNAENIVWTDGAPEGRYSVAVNYFNGSVSASYTVRVFYGSEERTYTGRLTPSDQDMWRHVTDFRFSGSSSMGQAAELSRFEAGSRALSRAARSVGVSAVEAMSRRGEAPGGSSLTLGGHRVPLGKGAASRSASMFESATAFDGSSHGAAEAFEGTGLPRSERSWTLREFLRDSRFDFSLGEEMRLWGEAHGTEAGGGESRFLGLERSFGHRLAAGAAFSDTTSEGRFGLAISESLTASLASAYQYLRFSPGASTEVWSLAGTGRGALSLTDDVGTAATDLSMRMLAFGSRHGFPPLVAGFAPTVSADGYRVRLESEGTAGLRALAGEASRLRTGVLFERAPDGGGWTPRLGFGMRHDDDERGVATRAEVAAGVGYVRDRLRVDAMGHLWSTRSGAVGSAGSRPQRQDAGARLVVRYDAAPHGRGLAASVDALAGLVPDASGWATGDVGTGGSLHVRLQASYGLASGLRRWTPYAEMQFGDTEHRLREGLRHEFGAVRLDLFGEHRLGAMSGHGIHLGLNARF